MGSSGYHFSAANGGGAVIDKGIDFGNYFCSFAFLYHQKDMLSYHIRMDAYYNSIFSSKHHFIGKCRREMAHILLHGTLHVTIYEVDKLHSGGGPKYMSILHSSTSEMSHMVWLNFEGGGFGFDVDNTIGSKPQINTWTADWIEFYGEHRLGYQLKLALDQYRDTTIYEKGKRLVKNMGPLFENIVIESCLLHGDLWSGNVRADKNGKPMGTVRPEYGMSWCAGFGGSFYNSYFEVMPKQPGFEKRRDLYMLYHYLKHYNLFGSDFRSSAIMISERFLSSA
ncbi:Fructosamine/Ketosamine-3-kinase [Dillenia turbinata]|uniref:protein-ribulosamine 3-kinase n=1 Tax=Dillenia turbinata TaxID=194707 RepID=A0AAN8UYU3_9MAGN